MACFYGMTSPVAAPFREVPLPTALLLVPVLPRLCPHVPCAPHTRHTYLWAPPSPRAARAQGKPALWGVVTLVPGWCHRLLGSLSALFLHPFLGSKAAF